MEEKTMRLPQSFLSFLVSGCIILENIYTLLISVNWFLFSSMGRQCWCLFCAVCWNRSPQDRLYKVPLHTDKPTYWAQLSWTKCTYLFVADWQYFFGFSWLSSNKPVVTDNVLLIFFRTGKRSTFGLLKDGLNSAIRYYKNNFADGFRQVSH